VCCTDVTAPVLPDINTGDSTSNETKWYGSKKISNQNRGEVDHSECLPFSQISKIDKSAAVIPGMRRAAPREVGRNLPSFCRLSLRKPGTTLKSKPRGIVRSARNRSWVTRFIC